MGWECPSCGTVNAPHLSMCQGEAHRRLPPAYWPKYERDNGNPLARVRALCEEEWTAAPLDIADAASWVAGFEYATDAILRALDEST